MNTPYCITACIWHDWAVWDKLSSAKAFCYSAKANVEEWNRVHNYHDKGERGGGGRNCEIRNFCMPGEKLKKKKKVPRIYKNTIQT